ncbi:hypothetical protein OH76DRAFT_1481920 [Lentinus brumalis]|uniref:Uncharacterized protein n=1 Tax=Lentinus brumalis TaxID=2498619 RepID=A0A371DE98_9APHY|nr:hypothetical protein OH76DRAFT_1481920 [Polyporus brumalis]
MDVDEFLELVDYVEAPPANPKRLYDAGDGKSSLQLEMGLQYAPDHFRAILSVIREVWRDLGVDTRVSYGSQDNALMRSVKKEALKRMPFLRIQYEDGWPVIFYLKRSLKGGHPRKGRKQVVARQDETASRVSLALTTSPCPVRGPPNILHSIDPTNRIGCNLNNHPFARSISASSASSSAASPSISHTAVSTVQPAASSPLDSQSIFDLLLSFHLPPVDAERLSAVFASYGIVNAAYLRVLGGLQSRDVWLEDLRAKGQLTEGLAETKSRTQGSRQDHPTSTTLAVTMEGDDAREKMRFLCTPLRHPDKIYETGNGYISLQGQMGLDGSLRSFEESLSVIREVWRAHGVNPQVPYAQQDPALIDKVKKEVIQRLPYLYEDYEDAWPIEFYLRKIFRYRRWERYKTANGLAWSNRNTNTREQSSLAATTSAPAASEGSNRSSTGMDADDEERSPSCSASDTEHMLSSCSTAGTGEIFELLVGAYIPHADTQRLVRLFASFGIKDIAYLRVFARMDSRDSWLNEMQQKGEVSEIQMRVIQELLRKVACD